MQSPLSNKDVKLLVNTNRKVIQEISEDDFSPEKMRSGHPLSNKQFNTKNIKIMTPSIYLESE
jgi:hypothetical protein